jgi:hypothetical protein
MAHEAAMYDALAKVAGNLPEDLVAQSLEHLVMLHAVDTWPNGESDKSA